MIKEIVDGWTFLILSDHKKEDFLDGSTTWIVTDNHKKEIELIHNDDKERTPEICRECLRIGYKNKSIIGYKLVRNDNRGGI